MSRITIKTKVKEIPVSRNLYGIFLEDINRAVDGGLYPEMIRNRSFEDSIPPSDCTTEHNDYAVVSGSGWRDEFNHGEGLTRWIRQNEVPYTPIPAWYCEKAEMRLDIKDTLNAQRQAALAIQFDKGGSVYNTGFCGVPQKKNATYNLLLFAKAETTIDLIISVRKDEKVFSRTEITVNSKDYSLYKASLTANDNVSDAKLEILSPEGGAVKFGFISLMPEDTYLGHGLRKDIVEKLRDIHPRFFRFPGGCIVEGFSPSTAMRFRNTVGPVWERPGHLLMWHYRTYNGVGFHEYLQLCEDLGMEPLYVFNCGMTCQARKEVLMEGQDLEDMIQDTLDAIEYAVGSKDTKWGSLRAKMGHPEPFKLNMVEIGNENFGPAYEERYLKCYKAIKQRYPDIKVVANTHLEKKGLPVDIVDEHYYNTAEYFAENCGMFEKYDRSGPKVFLGEVSVVRGYVGQFYGALGEAAFFTGVENNQDVVTMVSYAPLLENVNYNAWYPNLIRFNNTESYGIPSYYVWKLFGSHRGDHVVSITEQTDKIYRPVKGMASLLGEPDLVYRNAAWNGEKVEVTHELMGRVEETSGTYTVRKPDEYQKEECSRINGADPDKIFIIFGEENVTAGTFDIDIKVDKDREIVLGIFSSRIPKEVYISDETHPPKEWNIGNVRPFLWKIKNGKSHIEEQEYPENIILDGEKAVSLNEDQFNRFSYTTDGKKLTLRVNGNAVHEIDIPSFKSLHTVVTDTDKEVIIKMVNMSQMEDKVAISLDCDVSDEYRCYVLEGEKEAENSFSNPVNIHDEMRMLHGAAKEFVHRVPPLSVNILVLTKKVQ
jgi:alpha-L-arabinofuranosidase